MKYTFDDIAGYEQEKAELKKLCEIIQNRKIYEARGATLPKGVIFYGDTGTGKTLFAKVLASICGLKTLPIDLGELTGEKKMVKRIKRVFEDAKKSPKPAMILFDEIDKVLPNAGEEYFTDRSKSLLASLLTSIDGMNSGNNFIFVATCNDYGNLPQTLVRAGRIDKKIHLKKPDYHSRVEILNMYAKRTSCKFEMGMEELAKLCCGFSCAALERLVNECILKSDDEYVSEKVIRERLLESKSQDIPRPSHVQSDYIDACRNIGCFVVAKNFDDGQYLLRLGSDTVCNLHFNGLISYFDDDYDDEDGDFCDRQSGDGGRTMGFCDADDSDDNNEHEEYFTREEYLQALCALMGGYAAEQRILGKIYDNVGSCISTADLVIAGAAGMGIWGLELRYNTDRNDQIPYPPEYVEKVNDELERLLSECRKAAEAIVDANVEVIKKLIPVLVEKRSLPKADCEKLLPTLGGIKKVNIDPE